MNFQNMEYFLAVARNRNITKAADELGITQQALSNQISRIEQELNCKLFNRNRGFELTSSGKLFYESSMRILDINRQTESQINDINSNKRGDLKIGISHTRGQAVLPLLIPEFTKKYPDVSLTIVEGSTKDLEEELDKGGIDVMIGYTPFLLETAAEIDLMRERMFLVVPKTLLEEHFGKNADAICEKYRNNPDLRVFKDFPFVLLKKGDRIRTIAEQEFYASGIAPDIRLETDNIQTSFSLVSEGLGIGIYPELYLNSPYITFGNPDSEMRKKVEVFRFCKSDSRDSITIAIGYNEERYLSNIAKDFIKLSEQKFKQIS